MSVHPTDGRYFSAGKLPETLQLLFRLSRIFGLLPYDSLNVISRSWYIYSIFPVFIIMIGSSGFCIHTLYYTNFLALNPSMFTTTLLYLTQQGMQVVCLFSHILSIGLYRSDFDELLIALPEWAYSGEKSRFAGFWTVFGVIFLTFYYTFTTILANTEWSSVCWYTFVCLNEICIYLILIQFCTLLEIIEMQLKSLTLLLSRNRNLVPLTETHYAFVGRSSTVNSVYAWQILIICTLIFINFVSWLFNAMTDVMSEHPQAYSILLKVSYCMWQIANIYFIAGSCEAVVEKVETFSAELFRIMRESKNLCDNEKLNLYVSMKQTVKFTACGFFSVGYPLVTSIIAAATTYLVILVQFSLSSSSSSSTTAPPTTLSGTTPKISFVSTLTSTSPASNLHSTTAIP
ncbi:hypothetical protein GE061_016192 [Apolygus lucorum]|uniref:Gustatory receptor n=1 Tax=Apolygus lucorum TaxID=248454 RepID=A0A6A4JUW3_APOLU|nr:hypothetical protein GE061_016192 [Apolygus lucorum]